MDFKVGGTKKGITAIQVDIKVDGLTPAIIAEAFEKTRKARLYILDEIMLKAIPAPRDTVGESHRRCSRSRSRLTRSVMSSVRAVR